MCVVNHNAKVLILNNNLFVVVVGVVIIPEVKSWTSVRRSSYCLL